MEDETSTSACWGSSCSGHPLSSSSRGHARNTSEPPPIDISAPSLRKGHSRRTSAPPTVKELFASPKETAEESIQPPKVDRRKLLERNWSTTNITEDGAVVAIGKTESTPSPHSITDITAFQKSWTNTDGSDFLGASLRSSFPNQSQALGALEPAKLLRGASTAPKVDSDGVSSMVHDAARITDWDKVLALCGTNPECAKYVGKDGWTALHHSCNRRCPRPEVAEALIKAYPDALTKEADNGWLPLHYACRFKAPKEFVRLLLHMQPELAPVTVAKRDKMGRTPLYYAVRYDAPPGVVGLLLEVDPSVVLEEDQNEDSPLALVWDSWAEKLEGKRVVQSFLPGGFPEPEDTSVEQRAELLRSRLKRQPALFKRWKKANVLLKAAFGFPVEDDTKAPPNQAESTSSERKWRIVHATAAVKCHLSLFLLACALHPEQARELDESELRRPGDQYVEGVSTHQTALHLAASSNAGGEPGKTVIISLLSLHRDAAEVQDGIDGSLPLHRIVENQRKQDWPNHAAILYHFYPRAVQIPDARGKLPLHRAATAIQHVEKDNIDSEEALERSVVVQLVRSFPQAASHRDHCSCLPLHLIAKHGKVWNDGVEAVHDAHRGAVQVRAGPSEHNRLPIHMAAANPAACESLVSRITQLHPRAAAVADGQGKLPLHLACEIGKEWDHGVSCIYQAFPGALHQAEGNARGWLALHMASASSAATSGLIDQLVQLHSAGASAHDNQGSYPLHLACGSGKSWSGGLKTLFEANPSAVASVNNKGLLPLHVAAFHYCGEHATGVDVATVVNKKLSGGTEDIVATQDTSATQIDVLFNIIRADPTVLPASDQVN